MAGLTLMPALTNGDFWWIRGTIRMENVLTLETLLLRSSIVRHMTVLLITLVMAVRAVITPTCDRHGYGDGWG